MDPPSELRADADGGAAEAAIDAEASADALVEASADGDAGCASEQKVCNGGCVPLTSPDTGCATTSCDPCSFPHASADCDANGSCAMKLCESGFDNCDNDDANGCERNISNDPANCGTCGHVCPASGGTPSCTGGICGVTACASGKGDCDNDSTNGCETDIFTSVAHCGFCNNPCAPPFATPACDQGVCWIGACDIGRSDCDKVTSNGCEVSTNDDVANCGKCGLACAAPNASMVCTAGSCKLSACNSPWLNCDAMEANGCEINAATDPSNCGQCSLLCSFPNAAGVCFSGVCGMGACNNGFADCDMVTTDGCEAQLANDPKNCGACVHSCLGGTCTNGKCDPIVLASGQSNPFGIATDGISVYWGNRTPSGAIYRVPVTGGAPTLLASNQAMPDGLAINTTSVAWANFGDGKIQYVSKAGGAVTTLATVGSTGPTGVAATSTHVYFTNWGVSTVQRINTGGVGTLQTLSSTGNGGPRGITTDGTSVWWTNYTGNTVRRAPANPGAAIDVAANQGAPAGIAIDTVNVYWTNESAGTISFAPLLGTGVSILASGQDAPIGVAVDGTHVYWVNSGASGTVRRVPKGGGAVQTLASSQPGPMLIALDADALYWTNLTGGTVMRLAK